MLNKLKLHVLSTSEKFKNLMSLVVSKKVKTSGDFTFM